MSIVAVSKVSSQLLIFTLELLLFFLLVHLFSFSYFSSGVVLTSAFYMCNAGEINNSLHLTNYGEGILAIFLISVNFVG